MTVSVEISEDQATVTIEYTASTEFILDILDDAAREIYRRFPLMDESAPENAPEEIPYDDLTNKQKLGIINDFVKREIQKKADTYYVENEEKEARISATDEIKKRHL